MISIALNLKNQNVLIVGGGKVALRKARQMIKEGAVVTVLSPSFLADFSMLTLTCRQHVYEPGYLENMFLVYAATNDENLNHQIMLDCREKNILCGSATKDSAATFFSMAQRELADGLIAFSSHQKLPYTKPVLNQMAEVVQSYHPQIELLSQLRPAILKYAKSASQYFEQAFSQKTEVLQFLLDSYQKGMGYIFVYHPSKYEEHYQPALKPSLVVSIDELEAMKALMIFPVEYQMIPLVLSDGHIYRQIQKKIPEQGQLFPPLISTDDDLKALLALFERPNRELVCILHPRRSDELKQKIGDLLGKNGKVYNFDEPLQLCRDKSYVIIMFLMSHGSHYHDYLKTIDDYQKQGYDIENLGILTDYPEVMRYIEKRCL